MTCPQDTQKNVINVQYVNPISKSFFQFFMVKKYIFIVYYFHIHDPYLELLYHHCLLIIILLRIKIYVWVSKAELLFLRRSTSFYHTLQI